MGQQAGGLPVSRRLETAVGIQRLGLEIRLAPSLEGSESGLGRLAVLSAD